MVMQKSSKDSVPENEVAEKYYPGKGKLNVQPA